jgi:hypothetical protein
MDRIAMSCPFLFSELTLTIMKAIIATLLSVVIISCSEEEALVKKPEPLPETMLQFEIASMTIMECPIPGGNVEPTPVVILTNVAANAHLLFTM